MLKRKLRTFRTLLNDGGLAGVWRYIFRNIAEKTVVLNGCTFGSRGIENEVLHNDLMDGVFERFERNAVQEFVSPDLPVVELGGCLGVVGCITNRRLTNPQAHVVVEANPQVIPLLAANRRRNRCQFQVLNRAIAYGSDVVEFAPSMDFASNSLRESGGEKVVRVKTTGLGDILARNSFKRFTLICDIEGHECDLVEQEPEVLRHADVIILETHARLVGEERNQEMLRQLHELGFRVVASEAFVVVLKNQESAA